MKHSKRNQNPPLYISVCESILMYIPLQLIMENDKSTSIRIDAGTKEKLDTYKLIPDETHNSLIIRLLAELDQLRKIPQKNRKLEL